MNNNVTVKRDEPAMTADDVFYTLLRHKWKILLCAVAGFLAAAAFYVFDRPPYQSEAKLFIRYVVDNATPGPPGMITTGCADLRPPRT